MVACPYQIFHPGDNRQIEAFLECRPSRNLPLKVDQRLEMEEIKRDIGTDEFAVVVNCLLECFEMVESRAKKMAE